MQVQVTVLIERDLPAVDQAAGAPELGRPVQVVLLQEQEDVVLVNLYDLDVDGRQVDRAERQHQGALVRKDVAIQRKDDGRCRIRGGESGPELLGEGKAGRAADAAVDGERDVVTSAFIVNPRAVVADVQSLADHAGQFYKALSGSFSGKRLAEADLHARIAGTGDAGIDDLEHSCGRDDGLQR